jgi:hypothetical protein
MSWGSILGLGASTSLLLNISETPGPIFIKVRKHERRRKSERCIPLPVEWYSPVVQIRHQ